MELIIWTRRDESAGQDEPKGEPRRRMDPVVSLQLVCIHKPAQIYR
jgi:hypothetical protein